MSMLHVVAQLVEGLQGGSMHLYDVVGLIRPASFAEFQHFLRQAEVYGGGYSDDIDYCKANLRGEQTHGESLVAELGRVIQAYELALLALKLQEAQTYVCNLPTYHL